MILFNKKAVLLIPVYLLYIILILYFVTLADADILIQAFTDKVFVYLIVPPFACGISLIEESMKKPFTTLDLYKALNIKLSHVEQTITAEVTDSETNAVFGLNENGALVVLESVFYDAHSNPIEYKIGRYRSDFYSFKMKRMLK